MTPTTQTIASQVTEIPIPDILRRIHAPPGQLFHVGAPLNELLQKPRVAIVGSRSATPYGKQVTIEIASQLAARGIVIISGLAIGIDGAAHRAALEAGGLTIAVLPSPLDNVVPAIHRQLARDIIKGGGALISEYPPGQQLHKHNFVNRNRLMAGLADLVLVTEAAEKSGSLYTAKFAFQEDIPVMAVPGNVSNRNARGVNTMLKSTQAGIALSYLDILHELKIEVPPVEAKQVKGRNTYEQTVLDLIADGTSDGHHLLAASKLSVSDFNQVLTMLEISGKIRPLGGNHWKLQH